MEIHQFESLFQFPKQSQRSGQRYQGDAFQYSSNLRGADVKGSIPQDWVLSLLSKGY